MNQLFKLVRMRIIHVARLSVAMAAKRECSVAGFMQLFWDLSSLDEEERIESAVQLLKELQVAGLTLHTPVQTLLFT